MRPKAKTNMTVPAGDYPRQAIAGLPWTALASAVVGLGSLSATACAEPETSQPLGSLTLDTTFPEAYGKLGPVRELPDGRVLVADPLGQVLAVLDFGTGAADTLGRVGRGPQEYGQPDAIFPLQSDTSLLVDLGNARLAKLAPDGTFLETIPMGQQTQTGGTVVVLPRGVDLDGRMYFRSEVQPMGSSPDSAALLRFDPGTGALDTLAMLKAPELPPPPLPGGGGLMGKAAEPQDEWAVAPDGTVAIVRSGDFSVTWVSPDGTVRVGPSNPYRPVQVGGEEQGMWLAEFAGAGVSMRADESGTVSVFREDDGGGPGAIEMYEWPSALPPVKPGRVTVSPGGEVWAERFVSSEEDPLVQRFDREGAPAGEVRLPPGRRIAGFGPGWVYLARTDHVGLQWIERYRLDGAGEWCTAFALHDSGDTWVGKNLDWEMGEGVVLLNQRGERKKAWGRSVSTPPGEEAFTWVSRFGSLTFNQFGEGFPLGGTNEAGLVVEELSYWPARYPGAGSRAELSELEWIQYQLDNHESVAQVLASDTLVQIRPFIFGLHYFVADAGGQVAVIQFLGGKRVVHTGENLPVPVLANDTYENLLRNLKLHNGFGGTVPVTDRPESPERFARVAALLKGHAGGGWPSGYEGYAGAISPENFAFQVLESVKQDDTQWSIVYDLDEKGASFITKDFPSERAVALKAADLSCQAEKLALPLSSDTPGPWRFASSGPGSFQPWTTEDNLYLVRRVFGKLGQALSPEELPPGDLVGSMGSHASSFVCIER